MIEKVELRAAKIPYVGLIAVHYWFVVKVDDISQRWEIWQTKNLSQTCWGHLHLNLMGVYQGVGNGESWLETYWQGEQAQSLMTIIQSSPEKYPFNYLYRYYPGPNSNTYAQWVLHQGKINYRLNWRGLGKNYIRRINN